MDRDWRFLKEKFLEKYMITYYILYYVRINEQWR